MIFYIILSILPWLIIPGLLIWLSIRWWKKRHGIEHSRDGLDVFLSSEDALSQGYFLLGFLLLGSTLAAFNRELNDPLTWQMILFIVSVLAIIAAYYFKLLYTLALGIVGIVVWWGAYGYAVVDEKNISAAPLLAVYMIFFAFLYMVGHLHRVQSRFQRFSYVYFSFAAVAITANLFFLSTRGGLGAIEDYTDGEFFTQSWQMTVALVVVLVAYIAAMAIALQRRNISTVEVVFVAIVTGLISVFAVLPAQDLLEGGYTSQAFTTTGVFWTLLFNSILFVELLGMIYLGYKKSSHRLINTGAILIFLVIIIKYFDWFFTFLSKSVFFISAGILLFVLGWFMERGRRRMVATISQNEQQPKEIV